MKFKNILFALAGVSLLASACIKEDINYSEGRPNPEISLYVLKNTYKGGKLRLDDKVLQGAEYTGGVVISHPENKNLPANLIAVQGEWRGLTRGVFVEVEDANVYHFGDSIHININGAEIDDASGATVIKGVDEKRVSVIAKDIAKYHTPVTIGNLKKDFKQYEATLVSITADVEPEPSSEATLAGEVTLRDGEDNTLLVYTDANAVFATTKLAPSAAFRGVPIRNAESEVQLRLQAAEDLAFPSGKMYVGWPESFEDPSHPKGSYNMTDIDNNVVFSTGEWHLYQSIIGNTAGRDRIVSGQNAIRFQQNRSDDEYLQMNFDVPDGASKVTLWYGAYYTDRSSTFTLEYSIDQGETWGVIGEPISDAHSTAESANAKEAVFLMDIQQPVRFRVNKKGLGTSNNVISNGRLGVDDFAVFKSY